ncbi:MAG: hypothetical protein HGA39_06200 [Coriobacteriia bacterium]|nr:hypothetical protein [Coriobacteriia bacterium]
MNNTTKWAIRLLPVLIFALMLGLLVGCGSSKSSTDQGSDQTVVWSPDSDCGFCHAAELKSSKDAIMLGATHATAGVKCMSCHVDAEGLKSAHAGVTSESVMPTKLTKTVVDQTTCLSSACHNTTLAELAKKTAGVTVLTDSKGTTVNPHLAPTLTKAHVDAEMTCTSCHTMHKATNQKMYCLSCHHAEVFECGTCHN